MKSFSIGKTVFSNDPLMLNRKYIQEYILWCVSNDIEYSIKDEIIHNSHYTFQIWEYSIEILNDEDAIMFKLKFGL